MHEFFRDLTIFRVFLNPLLSNASIWMHNKILHSDWCIHMDAPAKSRIIIIKLGQILTKLRRWGYLRVLFSNLKSEFTDF